MRTEQKAKLLAKLVCSMCQADGVYHAPTVMVGQAKRLVTEIEKATDEYVKEESPLNV